MIQNGPLNEFSNCHGMINGQKFEINQQDSKNRMVYEMSKFRDAILNKDYEFFEQSAEQSICASMILEKAHL